MREEEEEEHAIYHAYLFKVMLHIIMVHSTWSTLQQDETSLFDYYMISGPCQAQAYFSHDTYLEG